MSFFSNFLNLGSTISRNVNGLSDDVFKTKKALGGLGLLSGAVNTTPDAGLFDSLKAFQKSAGLTVDGLMKPGGPTERGLNSLLQQTGVGERVFSERAPGQGTDKPDKPSLWFKQARLPQISAEASSSNGRTVGGLLKSSANGKLPLYQADALSSNKERAFGEYGDFLNQLHARDPGRVAGFEKDVMERLPSATKAKLATYFNQTTESKPTSSNRRSLLTGDDGKDDLSGAAVKPTRQTEETTRSPIQSPIDKDYRDAIADQESKGQPNNGYGARNSQGYLGRYQLGEPGLIDIGMKSEGGKWTGKYGIKNEQDFLKNPQAQERAFADYMADNEQNLRKNGSLDFIGKTFPGKKKEGILISKGSLLAAAHRRGHKAVKQYLEFQKENGWLSDFTKAKNDKEREKFENIETRLRLFQNKRY